MDAQDAALYALRHKLSTLSFPRHFRTSLYRSALAMGGILSSVQKDLVKPNDGANKVTDELLRALFKRAEESLDAFHGKISNCSSSGFDLLVVVLKLERHLNSVQPTRDNIDAVRNILHLLQTWVRSVSNEQKSDVRFAKWNEYVFGMSTSARILLTYI